MRGNVEIVKYLLMHGADRELRNKQAQCARCARCVRCERKSQAPSE